MQPPMTAAFMRKGETIAPFHRGALLGIEAFVDDDSAGVEPNCAEYVRVQSNPAARNIEQAVQIVELDAKLEVLLDDVLDWDRRLHLDAPGMGVLGEQGLGIAFDGVAEALSVAETELRLFGKPESFKKRRMGVAASRGTDTDEARARAKQAASAVKPVKS